MNYAQAMKKTLKIYLNAGLALLISISSFGQSTYEGMAFQEKDPADWENQFVFEINREAPGHGTFHMEALQSWKGALCWNLA